MTERSNGLKNHPGETTGRRPKLIREPVHPGPMMFWKINQRCNFTCPYCYFSPETLSREHPLVGRYSPRHIARCFDDTRESWWIYISGGEPFLYPQFVDVCRELARNHFLAVNTNLSTSNVLDFAAEVDPARVYSINASLHIAERERRTGLRKFVEYARALQKRGFMVLVEYVFHPELFGRIPDDMKMLKDEGLQNISLKSFQGLYRSRLYPGAYSARERDFFRNHALETRELSLVNMTNRYFGKPCRSGFSYFWMDEAGDVVRCRGSAAYYGNFLRGDYSMDKRVRPCPFPKCVCPYTAIYFAGTTRMNPARVLNEVLRESIPYLTKKAPAKMIFGYLKRHL